MTKKQKKLLLDHIEAREADIERFVASLGSALKKDLNRFLKELRRVQGDVNESIKILGQLEDAVRNTGFEAGADELARIYGKELAGSRRMFSETVGIAFRVTDTDLDIIEAAIAFDIDKTAVTLGAFGADARQVLFNQVFLGQEFDIEALQEELDSKTLRNIKTELNTSTQGFYRSVIGKKAADVGITTFIYVGPDDKKTRPFCSDILSRGGKFSREEIDNMDNGQGLNAFTYCGGYNCRHSWQPLKSRVISDAIANLPDRVEESTGV